MIGRSMIIAVALGLLAAAIATAAEARVHQEQALPPHYCGMDLCRAAGVGIPASAPALSRRAHAAKHRSADRRARPVLDGSGNPSANLTGGLITVPTAAGIDITVARDFAQPMQAFIADVVARGYRPRQIHCYARGGHIRGSLHYQGRACDFDQRGWGKTAAAMYHVADLAARHGLRDGGAFSDWGHIDAGSRLARGRSHDHIAGAAASLR